MAGLVPAIHVFCRGDGRLGQRERNQLAHYLHAPCARALASAAFAVSQSGIPSAILVQPMPQGVPPLSHQIRHQPSSKRTTAKSARAGTPVKPIASNAITKISRFIPISYAAKLPKRWRLSFCFSLRGGSLNSRAAVPPRMLCLAFSDRNGRSQIVDGRSKS